MNLFDGTMVTLGKALDYSAKRNEVIADNIANIDTPNFKSKDVTFKNVLHKAMNNQLKARRTHVKHIPFTNESNNYQIVTNHNTAYSHNGNNVDVDKEMTTLAKNQIYYQSMVDRLNGKFNVLQTVVRGGR